MTERTSKTYVEKKKNREGTYVDSLQVRVYVFVCEVVHVPM